MSKFRQYFAKLKMMIKAWLLVICGKPEDPILTHQWGDDKPTQGAAVPKKPLPPDRSDSVAKSPPERQRDQP